MTTVCLLCNEPGVCIHRRAAAMTNEALKRTLIAAQTDNLVTVASSMVGWYEEQQARKAYDILGDGGV